MRNTCIQISILYILSGTFFVTTYAEPSAFSQITNIIVIYPQRLPIYNCLQCWHSLPRPGRRRALRALFWFSDFSDLLSCWKKSTSAIGLHPRAKASWSMRSLPPTLNWLCVQLCVTLVFLVGRSHFPLYVSSTSHCITEDCSNIVC